jgi:hypothetical protein
MRIGNVAAPARVALFGAGLAGVSLLGVAACGSPTTVTVAPTSPASSHPATAAPRSAAPTPAVTKTVIRYKSVTATPTAAPAAPSTTAAPAAPVAPASAPGADPNVTSPWAVVSAYYGDIESGDYAGAWALLDSGMTTGQTYQQFVSGFSCTGSQDLSENWASGDEVNFDLTATDDCTGAVQEFSGTDTVQGGLIVAADVSQVG